MAAFLVEAYLSRADAESAPWNDVWFTAETATREGREVHLIKYIYIPEDEICFYLFEADSWAHVMETAFRSRMQIERFMNAVTESGQASDDPSVVA